MLLLGTARGVTDGVVTVRLDYEAHEPLASAALERLRVEALARFGLTGCVVEHRLGTIAIGEASVGIALSGPHRAEAFAAAEWLMTEIKRQVPIWKREVWDGGESWALDAQHIVDVDELAPPSAGDGRGR